MHKISGHINELAFAANNIAVAEVEGKKICVGKFQEKLFAFAYNCPHAGGLLVYGHIDVKGNIICPLHQYKYSLENGLNVSGEGYFLKTWPVEVKEEGVFVEMG